MSKQEIMFAHIESWESSTMLKSAYCRKHKLSLPIFNYWQNKKLTMDSSFSTSTETPKSHFISVKATAEKAHSPIIIEYPNGVKVHITDMSLLPSLIQLI